MKNRHMSNSISFCLPFDKHSKYHLHTKEAHRFVDTEFSVTLHHVSVKNCITLSTQPEISTKQHPDPHCQTSENTVYASYPCHTINFQKRPFEQTMEHHTQHFLSSGTVTNYFKRKKRVRWTCGHKRLRNSSKCTVFNHY